MLDPLIPDDYSKKYPKHYQNMPLSIFKKSEKNKTKKTKKNHFASNIEEKATELFEEDIDHFLENLKKIEKNLLEKPSQEFVEKYRKTIGSFLKKLNKNYAHFEFFNRKRIKCQVWHVIDEKLQEIYQGVIENQLKGILLLGKLQNIKGLIIDLKIGKEK